MTLITPTLFSNRNNRHQRMEAKKEEKETTEEKKEKQEEKEEKKTKKTKRTSQTYEETRAVTDSGNVDEIQYLIYVSQTPMPRAIEIRIL